MCEIMTFPKTFDEFAEQYKIVDKQEVYTNGTELIPIFRVKQWLEHCDDSAKSEGKWIEQKRFYASGKILVHYKCNLCGVYLATQANYCPNCGAKMKGGTE